MKPNEYAILDLYLGSFAARHDAYVKDSRVHLNEELTPEVARLAYSGTGFSVSGYTARWVTGEDGKRYCLTHIGAVDFDMDDGFEQAKRMRQNLLDDWDIPSLLVASRRGAHLWVTTHYKAGMVPANIVRAALDAMVQQMNLDPVKAEVFPKRSDSDWGVGALRMPLMTHPKTGVRYPAYDGSDRELTRLSEVTQFMADAMAVTTLDALYGLAKTKVVSGTYPRTSGPYRQPSVASGPVPKVSDLLGQHFGTQAVPGRSVRCPFHDDKHASLQIAKDDERAWCKSPTCSIHNDGRGIGSIELAERLTA